MSTAEKHWNLAVRSITPDELEILVMDVITSSPGEGVGAKDVLAQLRAAPNAKQITVRINSGGGSVTECFAIMSLLAERIARGATVTARVEGIAASAASLLTTVATRTIMFADSYLMLHQVSSAVRGSAADMESAAMLMRRLNTQLSAAYGAASQRRGVKRTAADYEAILGKGEDLYLDARQAVEAGLCDEIVGAASVAASLADISDLDLSRAPEALRVANYVINAAREPQPNHAAHMPPIQPTQQRRHNMLKHEIQSAYPEAYAAIFADGKAAEHKRVTGHIKMGESCKAGALAIENIKSGASVMDEDVFAAYQSEAINRRDIVNRQADELTMAAILDGVASGSGAPSTSAEADGEDSALLSAAADIFCGPRKTGAR